MKVWRRMRKLGPPGLNRNRKRALLLSGAILLGAVTYRLFDGMFHGRAPAASRLAGGTGGTADPAGLLARRSPGARNEGAQARAKKRLLASAEAPPEPATQRVLGTVRAPRRPDPSAPPAAGLAENFALPPGEAELFGLPPTSPIGLAALDPAILPPPPGQGLQPLPPGGGSPGGGSFVPQPPAEPETGTTPPLAPIPEPASWIAMLIGFAMIGHRLRRQGNASPARPRISSRKRA